MAAYLDPAKRAWRARAIRELHRLARCLEVRGFECSAVRFNPGGVAVSGEAYLYARRGPDSISAMATRSEVLGLGECVMLRSEDWPERLGGARGVHKRSGRNRFVPFGDPDMEDVAVRASLDKEMV